jgi:hypothetical protein
MLVGDCIDCLLQGVSIVRRAITFYAEASIVQVDRGFVTKAFGIEGTRVLAWGGRSPRSEYHG